MTQLILDSNYNRQVSKSALLRAIEKGEPYNTLRPLLGRVDPRPWTNTVKVKNVRNK